MRVKWRKTARLSKRVRTAGCDTKYDTIYPSVHKQLANSFQETGCICFYIWILDWPCLWLNRPGGDQRWGVDLSPACFLFLLCGITQKVLQNNLQGGEGVGIIYYFIISQKWKILKEVIVFWSFNDLYTLASLLRKLSLTIFRIHFDIVNE